MTVRGWGQSVAIAVGGAAAAAAGQLGLGYGLEVIRWTPAADGQLAPQAWGAGLTWVIWVAASSTFAGAILAHRLGGGPAPAAGARADSAAGGPPVPAAGGPPDPATAATADPAAGAAPGRPAGADPVARGLWRLVLATAAGLGGLTTVALVAAPARFAEVADVSSPPAVAAGHAAAGVLIGVVAATGALAARAVAANLLVTTGWLWLLAVAAVGDGVRVGREWVRVPLGFWEATGGGRGVWFQNVLLPDAGLALAAALVIGAVAGVAAARRGDNPIGVVVSGAVGPLVLAIGYLLTQPDLAAAAAVDLSRQLTVPYLVVAGLAGSVLVAAVRSRRPAAGTAHGNPGTAHGNPETAHGNPETASGSPVPAHGSPVPVAR